MRKFPKIKPIEQGSSRATTMNCDRFRPIAVDSPASPIQAEALHNSRPCTPTANETASSLEPAPHRVTLVRVPGLDSTAATRSQ